MASTIKLKTGTGSAVPSALAQGEVGINIDNGLIYYGSGSGNSVKQLESFTNISASGDVFVSQYIKHIGDPDTFINFTNNRIRFKAGNIGFFDMEKDGSAPYPATINPGGNQINFRVVDSNTNLLLKTDSQAFKVNLYHAGNQKLETTADGINITGNVTASAFYGNGQFLSGIGSNPFPFTGSAVISGSMEVTGSFGVHSGSFAADTGSFLQCNAEQFVSTGTGVPKISSGAKLILSASTSVQIENLIRLNPTTTESITNPENGNIICDSNTNKFRGYINGAWVDFH